MFQLFSKRRNEESYKFLEVGFHGDQYLLSLIDDLIKNEHIDCFIETGTNVGSTLAYVGNRYPGIQVLSCEPDREACQRARTHTAALPSVEVHNLRSQEFLSVLAGRPELFGKKCLFWLDAHGYGFEWPLKEEVAFIATHFKQAYVMVDDFKVPGLDCFRFDQYEDQVCSYDHIKAALGSRPHQVFYPTYMDRTSQHHPLIGWGLMVMGAEYAIPAPLAALMAQASEGDRQ